MPSSQWNLHDPIQRLLPGRDPTEKPFFAAKHLRKLPSLLCREDSGRMSDARDVCAILNARPAHELQHVDAQIEALPSGWLSQQVLLTLR